ncbi:MAG: alpha-hydroxy acid oxidase [Rhodospirillales bacterium]|jgi:isopentenyl diphosphate isomerase/L-lactate dehydrogenase-like FMN-dependent dehydrogenase
MPNYKRIHNVEDLRQAAAAYLPKPVFDFIDGGAEDEAAVRNNRSVFDRVRFRPRTMADVSVRSTATTLLGKPAGAPIAIAPMGGLSSFAPRAEVSMARACAAANIPYCLSTAAGISIEDLRAEAPDARLWFQLYVFKDDAINRAVVERAQAAGYDALMITTDTHVAPKRERDRRNGFSLSLEKTPRNVARVLARPRWIWDVLIRAGLPSMPVLAPHAPEIVDNVSATRFFGANRRYGFDYGHLRELRRLWKGKLLVKGVMRPDEAMQVLECGADGIVMSNHGGRNLEHAAAPLEMLPEVVDAVGKRMHVLIDSGFRRGTDVVKALALGAEGVLMGRPAAFAVAAGGEAGVGHLIGLTKDEIDRTLGYLGCTNVAQLGRDHVLIDRAMAGRNEPGF